MDKHQYLYTNYSITSSDLLKKRVFSSLGLCTGSCFSFWKDKVNRAISITEYQFKNNSKAPETEPWKRNSGEPYLNHTLRVALILIEEGLANRIEVILAAIMHDLYEDTFYTYEKATHDFGEEVADLIQCVTNVSAESEQFSSLSKDQQTELDYTGIINRCADHPFAFYIKFADRLDNLRTLAEMLLEKQYKKIDETKNYLLPLMKLLGARNFINYINEAIFMREQAFVTLREDPRSRNMYTYIQKKFDSLYALQSIQQTISSLVNVFCRDSLPNRMFSRIEMDEIYIYDLYNQILENDCFPEQMDQTIFSYRLHFICIDQTDNSEEKKPSDYLKIILGSLYSQKELSKLVPVKIDASSIVINDDKDNHFVIDCMDEQSYNKYRYGDLNIKFEEEANINEVISQKITVLTKDLDKIELPQGSTVMDFAFAIHPQLAIYLNYANVNGKIVKLNYRLQNNDKVKIDSSRDAPSISLDWVLECTTQKAKKWVVRYFKNEFARLKEIEKNQSS